MDDAPDCHGGRGSLGSWAVVVVMVVKFAVMLYQPFGGLELIVMVDSEYSCIPVSVSVLLFVN